jgi:hypothetical protein
MKRLANAILCLILLAHVGGAAVGIAHSQVPAKPAESVELLPTEVDAIGWLFAALTTYPEEDRPYLLAAWIPPYGDKEWIGVLNVAVNAACSQTPVLHRADLHAGGWLAIWNLRLLCPDPVQLARLIAVRDSLAVRDSVFHLSEVNIENSDGKTAFLAPHLQAAIARHATDDTKSERVDVLVSQLTDSPGIIYPADFLLEQLLTSARGKYPEFRQMDFQVKEGTPLGERLVRGGFFRRESKDRFGEKGALLIQSDVTGQSRVAVASYGVASRLPLAVTFDFNDSRTRPEQQFIRNLVEFESFSDASEALVPMSNGLWEGVLADANGNLQRVAPPNVVADSTKPDGHTKELEMGMSCFICHLPDNGYKTARNDMGYLLNADVDYFGEEIVYGGKTLTRAEAVAVVVARYGERIDEPDGILGRARRDFIRAIDTLTDYEATADGPTSSQRVGVKMKEIYHGLRYRRVDAEAACLKLGVRVPTGQGLRVLKQLVPPPTDGTQEDIVISLLRNGAEIKPDDFDAIRPEMARRAIDTRNTLVVEK